MAGTLIHILLGPSLAASILKTATTPDVVSMPDVQRGKCLGHTFCVGQSPFRGVGELGVGLDVNEAGDVWRHEKLHFDHLARYEYYK